MKKIERLDIDNFRGIEGLVLDELGDINVIVGRNNTGKSSILEAIYLYMTEGEGDLMGNSAIDFILRRRGVFMDSRVVTTMGEEVDLSVARYLMRNPERNVRIGTDLGQYTLQYVSENFPVEVMSTVVRGLNRRAIRERVVEDSIQVRETILDSSGQPLIIAYEFAYKVTKEFPRRTDSVKRGGLVEEEDMGLERRKLSGVYIREMDNGDGARPVIFFDHTMIETSGFYNPFVQNLRLLDSNTPSVDATELADFLSTQVNFRIRNIVPKLFDFFIEGDRGELIPLTLLGDGSKKSVVMYLALSRSDTTILLEEPENFLHPSLMQKMSELLVRSAQHNQLFVTTHSLEQVKLLIAEAKRREVSLKIYHLRYVEDRIKVRGFDLERADAAVNVVGVDIR